MAELRIVMYCDICKEMFQSKEDAIRLDAIESADGATAFRVAGRGDGMADVVAHEECLIQKARREDDEQERARLEAKWEEKYGDG